LRLILYNNLLFNKRTNHRQYVSIVSSIYGDLNQDSIIICTHYNEYMYYPEICTCLGRCGNATLVWQRFKRLMSSQTYRRNVDVPNVVFKSCSAFPNPIISRSVISLKDPQPTRPAMNSFFSLSYITRFVQECDVVMTQQEL